MELKERAITSCKEQIRMHINQLLILGMSKSEIEIELIWFIKYKLKED